MTYAAFLRGVNNIGSKTVKMDELKYIFEAIGLRNVRSILASGNIIFETTIQDRQTIVTKIERQLAKKLGYEVKAVVRNVDELHSIIKSNPFGQIKLTSRTKLFLTFLSEKPNSKLKIPYESVDNDFIILRIASNEIYSVVKLLPNKRPYRIISFLEKEFGKNITNRSWKTILKTVNAI